MDIDLQLRNNFPQLLCEGYHSKPGSDKLISGAHERPFSG